jgi:uncharacterized protein
MEQAIISFFQTKKDIVAVFLFGSQVKKNKAVPGDVDIAVLYHDAGMLDFRARVELQESLSSLLKQDVDLVILNQANPIFKFQIFQGGKLLLNNNPDIFSRFLVKSLMEYDDIKRVRAPIEKSLLKGSIYGQQ